MPPWEPNGQREKPDEPPLWGSRPAVPERGEGPSLWAAQGLELTCFLSKTRPHQMVDSHLVWKHNYCLGLLQPHPGAFVSHGLAWKVSLGPGLPVWHRSLFCTCRLFHAPIPPSFPEGPFPAPGSLPFLASAPTPGERGHLLTRVLMSTLGGGNRGPEKGHGGQRWAEPGSSGSRPLVGSTDPRATRIPRPWGLWAAWRSQGPGGSLCSCPDSGD